MLLPLFGKPDWKEIERIDSVLSSLPKPKLETSNSEAIKSHILTAIKIGNTETAPLSLAALQKQVHKVGMMVKLSSYARAMIKEHVFDRIEKTRNVMWLFKTKFILKRAVTYTLVVLLAITGVFSFMEKPSKVMAHPVTVLNEISGGVVVVRAGKVIVPTNNFVLYQNDIIETRDGTATVRYFDSSVSRLNTNTDIRFSKLYSDDMGLNTAVELDFSNGQAWSMVFDLFNDSFFKINMDKVTADVSDRATFSVYYASGGNAEIDVFNNFVDLTLNHSGQPEQSVVLKGYRAVVNSSQSGSKIAPVSKDNLPFVEREWVEDNIKKDREYVARITNEQTGGHFVAASSDKLEESLYSSLNTLERLRVKLNVAGDKFLSGEALLNEGKIDEARQNMVYFKQTVQDIKIQADALKATNPNDAKKLMDLMDERMFKYKKTLSMVTRSFPLYEAKQILRDTEIIIADNDEEKIDAMLDVVSSLMLETQDLVGDNKYQAARENLFEAQQVIESLQKFDLSGSSDLLKKVMDKKADIVKMSSLIENTSDSPEVRKEAKAVKDSSIQTIIDTASSVDVSKSMEVVEPAVKELNNFIKTYSVESDIGITPKIQLFLEGR